MTIPSGTHRPGASDGHHSWPNTHKDVTRIVANCVASLEHTAHAAGLENREISEYIDRLAQNISEIAIDALRAWPS